MDIASKRVIFLDIDGVLVTEASMCYWNREIEAGHPFACECCGPDQRFDPICASNFHILQELLPEDVRIVLSSTWRLGRNSLAEVKELFDHRDIDSSRVVDRTPELGTTIRGEEIQQWLSDHPEVIDFRILDDDTDMAHLHRSLVRTLWPVGLTLPIVYHLVNYFRKPPRR